METIRNLFTALIFFGALLLLILNTIRTEFAFLAKRKPLKPSPAQVLAARKRLGR